MALADALAPIYARARRAAGAAREPPSATAERSGRMRDENARLRDENEQLRRWQSVALALDAENQRLKANLHWIPDPAPSYVTARVVADAGGVYARAVLLSVGPEPRHPQGPDRAGRARPGRAGDRGRRAHRAGAADHRPEQPHPGDPGELARARDPGRHQRAAAAAAVLAGGQRRRRRASAWSPAPRPSAFPANLPVGTVQLQRANGAPRSSRRRCWTGSSGAHLRLRAGAASPPPESAGRRAPERRATADGARRPARPASGPRADAGAAAGHARRAHALPGGLHRRC